MGGRRSTQRKPMHTWGKHANSTQKGPSRDSNPEPTCSGVTVLTTTPPWSTVKSIVRKWIEYTTTHLPRKGRLPKLTDQARRALIQLSASRILEPFYVLGNSNYGLCLCSCAKGPWCICHHVTQGDYVMLCK